MLVTLPSLHPEVPTHPFAPKVPQARECAPIHCSFVVFTLDSHSSLGGWERVITSGWVQPTLNPFKIFLSIIIIYAQNHLGKKLNASTMLYHILMCQIKSVTHY